jgi:hypothetical protein
VFVFKGAYENAAFSCFFLCQDKKKNITVVSFCVNLATAIGRHVVNRFQDRQGVIKKKKKCFEENRMQLGFVGD